MKTIDVGYTVVGGVLGCAMLFLLVRLLATRILRRVRSVSKHLDAQPLPVIRYYLPDGLTQEQRRTLVTLRERYEQGDFLPTMHGVSE